MAEHWETAVAFARANPFLAAAVGLFLLYLVARKTKLFLFLVFLALLLGGVILVILELTGTGGAGKSQLYEKGFSKDVR